MCQNKEVRCEGREGGGLEEEEEGGRFMKRSEDDGERGEKRGKRCSKG